MYRIWLTKPGGGADPLGGSINWLRIIQFRCKFPKEPLVIISNPDEVMRPKVEAFFKRLDVQLVTLADINPFSIQINLLLSIQTFKFNRLYLTM